MSGFDIVIVVVVLLAWAGLIALVLRGWRNRGRRQQEAIGELPPVPADLGPTLRGPDTGLYVGSTFAPSWQNRVAVGDIGDRAAASVTGHADGILVSRQGASEIWIPREAITAVRTERGLAGKVMTADGVLAIRWVLPSGTEIDSGIRADDKTVYPGWVTAYDPGAQPASGSPTTPTEDEQRKKDDE